MSIRLLQLSSPLHPRVLVARRCAKSPVVGFRACCRLRIEEGTERNADVRSDSPQALKKAAQVPSASESDLLGCPESVSVVRGGVTHRAGFASGSACQRGARFMGRHRFSRQGRGAYRQRFDDWRRLGSAA
jgi:hypothetical protein